MPTVKSPARQKPCWHRAVWCLVVALTMPLSLCLIIVSPASAQDLSQNFQFSYDPVTFDKSEINGSEVFHATIAGRVTCTQDLPISVSEAVLTSQVVAEHANSGTMVTLNSSYTITVKPFPSKKDETFEIDQSVPLQFPAPAEPGDYNIIGKVIEAKVKAGFIALDVTGYLPQEQPMGSVKYIASESTPPPASAPPPASPQPPPPTPTTPVPSHAPTPAPAPSAPIMPFWGELIVLVAVATTIFNIIWFLRHRRR